MVPPPDTMHRSYLGLSDVAPELARRANRLELSSESPMIRRRPPLLAVRLAVKYSLVALLRACSNGRTCVGHERSPNMALGYGTAGAGNSRGVARLRWRSV